MHGFVKRKLGVAGEWREAFRARVVTGRKCDQNSRGPLRGFRAKVKKNGYRMFWLYKTVKYRV